MEKLVILLTNILDRPGVPERLAFYQGRVDVAVLDFQGGLSIEERLSKSIRLMADLPIHHYLISGDPVGRAYWLRQSKSGFPTLRKFKATRFPWGDLPEEGHWEKVDVPGFNKPFAHLIEVLMQDLQTSHASLVWESGLDREVVKDLSAAHSGAIFEQSTDDWLECKTPRPWQQRMAQPTNQAQSTSRYFEYVDPTQNSHKFWEITMRPDGLGFETKYGRLGTKGQSKLKVFTTTFACQCAYDDIIKQKLRKGYVEDQGF